MIIRNLLRTSLQCFIWARLCTFRQFTVCIYIAKSNKLIRKGFECEHVRTHQDGRLIAATPFVFSCFFHFLAFPGARGVFACFLVLLCGSVVGFAQTAHWIPADIFVVLNFKFISSDINSCNYCWFWGALLVLWLFVGRRSLRCVQETGVMIMLVLMTSFNLVYAIHLLCVQLIEEQVLPRVLVPRQPQLLRLHIISLIQLLVTPGIRKVPLLLGLGRPNLFPKLCSLL